MTGLRIGSLCTGYGGLDMAVMDVLGGTPVWVADPDPGAARILAHHHPGVPNLGDITRADWAAVGPVDVLTAGFPCQDLSYAGGGAGIREGTRSGLWYSVAAAAGALRPRLLVLENVRAIVGRRPGLDAVLASLAGLGFDARWTCVRASDVGAAHQRDRWFCTAWPADAGGPGLARRWAERTAAHGRLAAAHPPRVGEREPADQTHPLAGGGNARPVAGGRGTPGWGRYGPAVERWEAVTGRPAPRPVDDMGRLNPPLVEWLMGLPAGWVTAVPALTRTQQLRALGNGVVPAQAAHALRTLLTTTDHGTAHTAA